MAEDENPFDALADLGEGESKYKGKFGNPFSDSYGPFYDAPPAIHCCSKRREIADGGTAECPDCGTVYTVQEI